MLVDPKRVTFNGTSFRSAISAHLEGPIRAEIEDTLPALEQLIEVLEERYELFERAQVIEEYNEQAQPAERLYRRVLVIDEFQDLFADESSCKAFFDGVRRLGAKARAARVHLILPTQRRDKDTVPPIIKANLGCKSHCASHPSPTPESSSARTARSARSAKGTFSRTSAEAP